MSLALILGMIIGAVLGLTGAGGGMLAVPALVAGMGLSMQQAAPIALIAVSASAAFGAWDGWRHRLLRWRGAILMATIGAPMTWIGSKLALHMSQSLLQGLFALAMVAAAARMLRSNQEEPQSGQIAQVCETTGRFNWNWPTALLLGLIGSICGLLTGLLGVGGGFVMVPLLRRFSNVSMQGIVATSLAVIALVGGFGVLSALTHGTQVPVMATSLFAGSCMVGMVVGRALAKRLPTSVVQRVFAVVLLLIAAAIFWRIAMH